MYRQLKNPHFYLMILSDAFLFVVAHLIAYLIRFEFALNQSEVWQCTVVLPWLIPLKIAVFFFFGLYRGMWRYTSIRDFWHLAQACFATMLLEMITVLFLYRFASFSRAVFLLDGGFTFLLVGSLRMAIRSYFASHKRTTVGHASYVLPKHRKKVLIIGAGAAGEKILREIFDNYQLNYDVVGLIDDAPHKLGRSIHGVPVLGSVKMLPDIIRK